MATQQEPDTATLRLLAAKHRLDPRTVAKAIRGEPVKGERTQEAARKAVTDWKQRCPECGGVDTKEANGYSPSSSKARLVCTECGHKFTWPKERTMKALSKKTVNVNNGPAVAKAKASKPLPDVWEDCDKRARGADGSSRRLYVNRVSETHVIATTQGKGGRSVQISRSRMKPTPSGYKLVERDGKAVA